MSIGLPADFVNSAFADLKRTVNRFPVTKIISNIEGDETIEPGPEEEIEAIVYPITVNAFEQGKEGLYEDGDARMFTLPATNIQKNDLISWEGRFYRVDSTVERFSNESASTPIYDYSLMFLHEGIPFGPVPGTGRFIGSFRGDPESASKGDHWYNTDDRQYKGFDGTQVVLLG